MVSGHFCDSIREENFFFYVEEGWVPNFFSEKSSTRKLKNVKVWEEMHCCPRNISSDWHAIRRSLSKKSVSCGPGRGGKASREVGIFFFFFEFHFL